MKVSNAIFSKLILLVSFFVLIFSCKKVDISKIKADVQIVRYDSIFFTLNQIPDNDIFYKIKHLRLEDSLFFDLYTYQLLGLGVPENSDFLSNLKDFFIYCDEQQISSYVQRVFPYQDDFLIKSLNNVFKYFKYYFNDNPLPSKIYCCITGYGVSVFTSDSIIGLSLDKYLGKSHKPYNAIFEKYLLNRMSKEYISVDVAKAWLYKQFPYNDSSNTLLNRIIYEGAIQYALDFLLPNVPDTVKWGYSSYQWKWANKFERKIWDYLVGNNLLFTKKNIDIKTFVDEAPFTTPFTQYSAPRAGVFIGYKIVKSFMKYNKKITLQELLKISDYNDIFSKSYYKP